MEDETTKILSSLATTPDAWLIKSIHLFDCADNIFERSSGLYRETYQRIVANKDTSCIKDATSYLQVGLLLAGYGFETIMKYAYIKENIESIQINILDKKILPNILVNTKSHDLIEFSKHINYLPKLNLRHFLKILSEHIKWAGRYPIPKKSSEFENATDTLYWYEGHVNTYYDLRNDIFTFLGLDYDQLLNFGIGLSS